MLFFSFPSPKWIKRKWKWLKSDCDFRIKWSNYSDCVPQGLFDWQKVRIDGELLENSLFWPLPSDFNNFSFKNIAKEKIECNDWMKGWVKGYAKFSFRFQFRHNSIGCGIMLWWPFRCVGGWAWRKLEKEMKRKSNSINCFFFIYGWGFSECEPQQLQQQQPCIKWILHSNVHPQRPPFSQPETLFIYIYWFSISFSIFSLA